MATRGIVSVVGHRLQVAGDTAVGLKAARRSRYDLGGPTFLRVPMSPCVTEVARSDVPGTGHRVPVGHALDLLLLHPHKAITFGEHGDIDGFCHGIVLICGHAHREGCETDKRPGHFDKVLAGERTHGGEERLVIGTPRPSRQGFDGAALLLRRSP